MMAIIGLLIILVILLIFTHFLLGWPGGTATPTPTPSAFGFHLPFR
jgi:hypothetical protein